MKAPPRHRKSEPLRTQHVKFWPGLFLPLVVCAATNKTAQLPPGQRPASWATPLEKPGLPNLHQVSPTLYRGAQPSHEGMLQLQQMGVKTVIALRGLHRSEERRVGKECRSR